MEVKIGNILEVSLVDVLFHPSFVIWFSNCNFRCPWCQNKELVFGYGKYVKIEEIEEKIKENLNFVDYLHITGGEPTLQPKQLFKIFEISKELGLKNSINTNGSNPEIIEKLIEKELINHIALDFKAPIEKYEKLIGIKFDINRILKTLEICNQINFVEIRTTFVPNFLCLDDIIKIVEILKIKLKNFYYVIQQFNPSSTLEILDWKYLNSEEVIKIAKKVKEKTKLEKIYVRTKAGVKEI